MDWLKNWLIDKMLFDVSSRIFLDDDIEEMLLYTNIFQMVSTLVN